MKDLDRERQRRSKAEDAASKLAQQVKELETQGKALIWQGCEKEEILLNYTCYLKKFDKLS